LSGRRRRRRRRKGKEKTENSTSAQEPSGATGTIRETKEQTNRETEEEEEERTEIIPPQIMENIDAEKENILALSARRADEEDELVVAIEVPVAAYCAWPVSPDSSPPQHPPRQQHFAYDSFKTVTSTDSIREALQKKVHGKLFGREEVRSKIQEELKKRGTSIVALVGASGVGKTHLALTVALDWMGQNEQIAFYLDAADETAIMNSYKKVLSSFNRNLEFENASLADLAKAMRDYLPVECLLVYDNVPDPVTFRKFSVPFHGLAGVLLATQDIRFRTGRLADGESMTPLDVTNLDPDAAVDMLLTGIPDCANIRETAMELVHRLDSFPLALQAANGELRTPFEMSISPPEDVELTHFQSEDAWCESPVTVLKQYMDWLESTDFQSILKNAVYKRSLANAVDREPSCQKVLEIAAYLCPDGMEGHVLIQEASQKPGLRALILTNLLQMTGERYSMNRLLQKVTQDQSSPMPAIYALLALVEPFDRNMLHNDKCWEIPSNMVRHVEAVCKAVKDDYLLKDENDRLAWARLLERTGLVLRWTHQDFDKARGMLERALDIYKKSRWSLDHACACSTAGKIEKAASENDCALQHLLTGMTLLHNHVVPLSAEEMVLLNNIPSILEDCDTPLDDHTTIARDRNDIARDKTLVLKADLWDDIGRVLQNKISKRKPDQEGDVWQDTEQCFNFARKLRCSILAAQWKLDLDLSTERELRNIGLEFLEALLRQKESANPPLAHVATKLGIGSLAIFTGKSGDQTSSEEAEKDSILGGLSDSFVNLARLDQKRGQWKDAQRNFEVALGAQYIHNIRQEGRCGDAVATTLSHLGRNLLKAAEESGESAKEAMYILMASYRMTKTLHGDESKNVSIATAINNVASAHRVLGTMEFIKKHYLQAMLCYMKALDDHCDARAMLKDVLLVSDHKKIQETDRHLERVLENAENLAAHLPYDAKEKIAHKIFEVRGRLLIETKSGVA
jgi:tetratricopeptide (TPR) repeat protein